MLTDDKFYANIRTVVVDETFDKKTKTMPNQALLATLKDVGLTEHEALVYLASLALGPSTVANIAQEAGIKRTTMYYVIESLQRQGMMNIAVKGLKQLFVAENPEKLESVLEIRKREFKKALPEFSALYNLKGGESTIRYYEGLVAVKNIYEEFLHSVQPHDDWLVVSDTTRWQMQDPVYLEHYRERRAKTRADVRLLLQDSDAARKQRKFAGNYHEQVKLLPKGTDLTANVVVIPNKIMMNQLTAPISAIVIENSSVVAWHKQTFEILWNGLPEPMAQRPSMKST